MGPEALAQVLRPLATLFPPEDYPDLLQGLASPDDAAVWRLDSDRALVFTADFFPPVVDDPYHFGAIAAANALSDLYAMGAEPFLGINLVGFPEDLDPAILSEVLRGGGEKMREAGAVVAGGHTTRDREPKYGLAVAGIVHPDEVLAKGGIRPGDVLFLTKPIGTGIVTTAHKAGKVGEQDLAAAIASMERLNRGAARLLRAHKGVAHAATDVTGFSLAGHAHEMAHLSRLTLRLRWESVPQLPGVMEYAKQGHLTGGGKLNQSYYGAHVRCSRTLSSQEQAVLYDPQTSGGLLVAAEPARADSLERAFREAREPIWRIGEAVAGEIGRLELV